MLSHVGFKCVIPFRPLALAGKGPAGLSGASNKEMAPKKKAAAKAPAGVEKKSAASKAAPSKAAPAAAQMDGALTIERWCAPWPPPCEGSWPHHGCVTSLSAQLCNIVTLWLLRPAWTQATVTEVPTAGDHGVNRIRSCCLNSLSQRFTTAAKRQARV